MSSLIVFVEVGNFDTSYGYNLHHMLALNLALTGLLFSIIFSSSEIALISANKLQFNVWLKQNRRGARLGLSILKLKEEYLTTILFGTNLSNVLATSFATVYLAEKMSYVSLILIISAVILLFGEVMPKTIIREHANIGLLLLSPILIVARIIFYPINYFFYKAGLMKASSTLQTDPQNIAENRDDLQFAYEQVHDPGTMEKDQQDMISSVFEFSEATVSEAMTPRIDISAISINNTLEEALQVVIDSGHSKLPVFDNDLDNIVGVVHLYDFFNIPENIADIVKPILHIPFSKLVTVTLSEFQTAYHAMAIVLDEHGGTAGIVTAEDLFEELFGEFEDEFDADEHKSEVMVDGSILTSAGIDWETFNEKYGEIIPEGSYETIGGYLIETLGRIPLKGEQLNLPIGNVIVKKASARKIEQVQIYPHESE
ncbi:MAG: HlyC/CorC family transporter [FCB group bacterium]|nr:HlyC/CorC family transporter [FCB group bacterium]